MKNDLPTHLKISLKVWRQRKKFDWWTRKWRETRKTWRKKWDTWREADAILKTSYDSTFITWNEFPGRNFLLERSVLPNVMEKKVLTLRDCHVFIHCGRYNRMCKIITSCSNLSLKSWTVLLFGVLYSQKLSGTMKDSGKSVYVSRTSFETSSLKPSFIGVWS